LPFSFLPAAITNLALTGACVGFGLWVLKLFAVFENVPTTLRHPLAFCLGFGVIGWALFFIGVSNVFRDLSFVILLAVGLSGLWFVRRREPDDAPKEARGKAWLFAAALVAVIFGLDFVEALSPAGDADSLGYHFAFPKAFLQAGRLFFDPHILDGAVPLLVQMTYLPALSLGAEHGVTLWMFASELGAAAMLYALSRQHLDRTWSLLLVAIFFSIPVVIYNAGSGQVEIRNSLFVMSAAYLLHKGTSEQNNRLIAVAGIAAGFFAGGKYLGLLFVASCGLVLILRRANFRAIFVFSIAAAVAGGQWYVWNWGHTGDPVFPALYSYLGDAGSGFWDSRHQTALQTYLSSEIGIAVNPINFFLYPVLSTFATEIEFDSLRAGVGPWLLLTAPFVVGALCWKLPGRWRTELFTYGLIALLFYTLWFFSQTSQRVRHMEPLLPLVFLCCTVGAYRMSAEFGKLAKPLAVAVAVTIGFQLITQVLFTSKSVRYVASSQSPEEFLTRSVSGFDLVQWINQNLSQRNKVLISERWYRYLLDVPHYWTTAYTENQIDWLRDTDRLGHFHRQIQRMGITHVLSAPVALEDKGDRSPSGNAYNALIRGLENHNCAVRMKEFEVRSYASRTLPSLSQGNLYTVLYQVAPSACRI
jgi:hypothetical protein